jgi:hypothetical protein
MIVLRSANGDELYQAFSTAAALNELSNALESCTLVCFFNNCSREVNANSIVSRSLPEYAMSLNFINLFRWLRNWRTPKVAAYRRVIAEVHNVPTSEAMQMICWDD